MLFKIALKFIGHKTNGVLGFVRKTFLLSGIGLILSIFSLILLDSLSKGYKATLKEKLISLKSHISIYSDSFPEELAYDIINDLKYNAQLDKCYLLSEEMAIARNSINIEGVRVITILNRELDMLSDFYQPKTFFNHNNSIAILGSGLYEKLKVDSSITLVNSKYQNIFNKKARIFSVHEVFKTGDKVLDNNMMIVDSKTFLNFFNHNKITNIKLYLKNKDDQEKIANLVRNKINSSNYSNDTDYYSLYTFNEEYLYISRALNQIFNAIYVIITFFLLLSILNIISSIWLIIESKRKQIKLLILEGMRKIDICIIFTIISLISISIFFLCGYVLAEIFLFIQNHYQIISISSDVYLISELIGIIDYKNIFILLIVLISIGGLMSLFSSYKAIYKKNKINV